MQILGLRDYDNKKREVFFNKGWRLDSIEDVFSPKLGDLLARVPQEERYNLYFTVADCFEEAGRKLKEQWAVPFDIDDLHLEEGKELETAELAVKAAAEVLKVPYDQMAVCFSGNGVQFFVRTKTAIVSEDYFEQTRPHYNLVARMIQNKLDERGIQGKVDVSVWSKARLMRLPGTLNQKKNRPTREARILNGTMVPQDFDIVTLSGITHLEEPQHISQEALKNYPKPDTPAVCAGCKFLVNCKEKPAEVSEPEWYAMLSITARLDDGRELSHQYSSGHAQYNHYETENKIDQTLAASGPRTCKNIEGLWNGCQDCDYYGKVTSPIMIKSEAYIASGDYGFRERIVDKQGNVRPGKPAYQDLVKQYLSEHPYRVMAGTEQVYIYQDKIWKLVEPLIIKEWAMQKVKPSPSVNEMNEFFGILKVHNVTRLETFQNQSEGLIPFKNVVVNRETGEVMQHGPEHGFFHCLEFDYDPLATAPRWEQFLLEISNGDHEIAQLLSEFGGYCLSGDDYWLQRVLVLVGDGANGKSVFMETLGEVAGESAYSSVSIQQLEKDTMRYQLVNKLFNYSEESSVGSLMDSENFKAISAGGRMIVKQLYVQPYTVFNRAKIIMSANNMPTSKDKSHGFYRRLAIVEFKRQFNPGDEGYDPFLKDKLKAELPGIANSLLKAYAELRRRRVLPAQEQLAATMDQYKKETDTVRMFFDDHLELSDPETGPTEKVAEVYDHYRLMCEQMGFKPLHVIQFSKQLTRINPTFEVRRATTGTGNNRQRIYRGLKLHKEF